MTEVRWIDTIFDATKEIADDAYTLSSIARAMACLGMKEGADEIFAIADRLIAAEQAIRSAVGQECGDSAKRSEEATGNMLKALIGGMRIGGLNMDGIAPSNDQARP
jgi:hypothetical protein